MYYKMLTSDDNCLHHSSLDENARTPPAPCPHPLDMARYFLFHHMSGTMLQTDQEDKNGVIRILEGCSKKGAQVV